MNKNNSYRSAFMVVTTLFFLWGFITVLVDSLIPRLHAVFGLSNFEVALVQFAFFGAYFLLSIPASFILSKIGYKRGIILGLLTMAAGCFLFYPAASYRMFGIFLVACFVLAGGITILQVAANPFVAVLGSEDGAASRLNLSQAFNSLGTAIAPIIGALFILKEKVKNTEEIEALSVTAREVYYASEAAAVQTPFLCLAIFIFVMAGVFMFANIPKLIKESTSDRYTDAIIAQLAFILLAIGVSLFPKALKLIKLDPSNTYVKALNHKNLRLGVMSIFFYVGAEVTIGSFLVIYFSEANLNLAPLIEASNTMMNIAESVAALFNESLKGADEQALLGIFVVFYWSGAMIGRFVGSYLTKVMKPAAVLGIFATAAMFLIMVSISTTGLVSMWSILAVGLFNSIMFPTIFTMSLNGLGDLKPKASGLLCTAIFGGAIIPPLYGALADRVGFKMAFIFVILCYGYILFFAWRQMKAKEVAVA